jgi:RNA polymerase sigma-70 factor (ECF subfamily)
MASDPDAALMLALQGGDAQAFRSLVGRHAHAVVAFCHRVARDPAQSEELAQEVFLELHRTASRYRPSVPFRIHLYRVAARRVLTSLRARDHALQRELRGPGGAAAPEPAPARAVRAALARLPDDQRAAFVLGHFEGLSYAEIADVLQLPVSAVKPLMQRAAAAATEALAPQASPGGGA